MKTIGLILAWWMYHEQYQEKARGIIFRRSFSPELEEVIYLGNVILRDQHGWSYNKTSHVWTHPRTKAELLARYLESSADAMLYQGHSYGAQFFDEIGNWPDPEPMDLLYGSLRNGHGIPNIRRSTCNPGGPGHSWVLDRYRPDLKDERIRDVDPIPGRTDLPQIERQFIPSRMDDNPFIDHQEYEGSLAAVGNEKIFLAWRHGDWTVIAGAFFDIWNAQTMVVDPASVNHQTWDTRWMSGDWGFDHPSVIYWHRLDENRNAVTYYELKVQGKTPQELGKEIAEINRRENFGEQKLFAFSPDAFAEKSSARTIALELGDELGGSGVPRPSLADNDREGGWMLMYQLLLSERLKITANCRELIKCIPLLQRDPKNSEDVQKAKGDDPGDGARYGYKTFLGNVRVPKEELRRRFVVEKVPEAAGMTETKLAAMPDQDRAAYFNRVQFATIAAEAKVRVRSGRRRSPWSRVG